MSNSGRFLELLTLDQVRQIHLTALRVLEEVGLWLPCREALELLDDAGAWVDFAAQTARIPAHLVEACLQRIPPRFTWYARDPAYCLDMNGLDTYFGAPDSAINVIDLEGRRRPGTVRDGEAICRLCDALPNLAITSTGVHPPKMPEAMQVAWFTMTMYTQSSKAVFGVSRNKAISLLVLRMAEVVADACDHLPAGELPLMAVTNTVSPLYNAPHQLEGMLEYVRRGVPLLISPEVQAGATGPATLAGTLVQATAEFLGHATIAELLTPGLPLMYGCVSSVFDMKKMMLAYGAPAADLLCIATAQMARYYGIPSRGTGGSSDANALGMQAGVESLMSNLACVVAGITYVCHAAGELQNTLAVSYEKTVLDDEIIGMARRFAKGIEVTPETLAFDVIKEVGPRGHYLGTDHTRRHFRTEQFLPDLLVRDKYGVWEAAGGKRAEERARDRVHKLLAEHQPKPLPGEVIRELESVYTSAKRSAGVE